MISVFIAGQAALILGKFPVFRIPSPKCRQAFRNTGLAAADFGKLSASPERVSKLRRSLPGRRICSCHSGEVFRGSGFIPPNVGKLSG